MTGLVEVRLIGLPLDLHQRAAEHAADVLREFDHLAEGPHASLAPARLIELDRILSERFGPFVRSTEAELEASIDRGERSVDLVYEVPPEAAGSARELEQLWDEVDDYCRAGEYLLALATDPEQVDYRRWFLQQFVSQIGGRAPTSWKDWRGAGAPS